MGSSCFPDGAVQVRHGRGSASRPISRTSCNTERALRNLKWAGGKDLTLQQCVATLEMMLIDGWGGREVTTKRPRIKIDVSNNEQNTGIRDIDGTLRLKFHDGVAESCENGEAKASS